MASGALQGVIVLGDFNDFSSRIADVNTPGSRGGKGNVPLADTVDIIRKGTSPMLVEVSERIPRSDRYTYGHGSLASQIDHILISPDIDTYITDASIDHTDAAGKRDEESDAWKGNRGSDHWPFKITLVLPSDPTKSPQTAGSPTVSPSTTAPTVPRTSAPRARMRHWNVVKTLVESGESCPSAPSLPADRRPLSRRGKAAVVCTYNMYWLFDGKDDPSAQSAWDTTTQATNHIKRMAQLKGFSPVALKGGNIWATPLPRSGQPLCPAVGNPLCPDLGNPSAQVWAIPSAQIWATPLPRSGQPPCPDLGNPCPDLGNPAA
eukprot:gene57392-biopygen12818